MRLETAHPARTLCLAFVRPKLIDVLRFVQSSSIVLFAHLALACSSASDDEHEGDTLPDSECEGRSQEFAPGMSASTSDGSLSISLVSATPEIPSNTDNFWTLALADSNDEPVDDATVVAIPYMVDHGHGTAPQLATSIGDGHYELGPITLTMPGFWEVTLEITPAEGEKTSAIYAICAEPK